MLDLMHDGEPRGYLTAGGVTITTEQLARLIGATVPSVRRWLVELEERKVFSRTEAGVIYSRRMVKDEHISEVRRHSGKLGGNPDLVKQNPKQPDNQNGKQKPTPAVAVAVSGLQSAVATASNSESDAPAAALLTPADLPAAAAELLTHVEPRKQASARREMSDLLNGGCTHRRAMVHATPERLEAKCRLTLLAIARGGVSSPWAYTLEKLADTSDGSAPGVTAAKADADEQRRDEQTTAADEATAERWLNDHLTVAASIEEQLNRDGFAGEDDFTRMGRRMARRNLVLAAWSAAQLPRANNG
jgi:hypothetical protein